MTDKTIMQFYDREVFKYSKCGVAFNTQAFKALINDFFHESRIIPVTDRFGCMWIFMNFNFGLYCFEASSQIRFMPESVILQHILFGLSIQPLLFANVLAQASRYSNSVRDPEWIWLSCTSDKLSSLATRSRISKLLNTSPERKEKSSGLTNSGLLGKLLMRPNYSPLNIETMSPLKIKVPLCPLPS